MENTQKEMLSERESLQKMLSSSAFSEREEVFNEIEYIDDIEVEIDKKI